MKTSYKIAALLALVTMNSCTLDPYVITKEEEYTRSFIKRFGLISPEQDWNLAVRAEVPVKVDRPIGSLKVYAEVDGAYYLVADYRNVSKDVRIPVDIPGETRNIKVKADGKLYYGRVGNVIDCTAVSSRAVHDEYMNKTVDRYTVTVERQPSVPFNAQQMGPIIAQKNEVWPDYWSINDARMKFNNTNGYGLLPEKGVDDTTWGNGNNVAGNRNNEGITQDFVVEPEADGTFTIYPMYWNTATQHTLGIYLINDEGEPIRKDGEIIKFPIYRDKEKGDIEMYLKGSISLDRTTLSMSSGDTDYLFVIPNVDVTWTTTDANVATISQRNTVSAKNAGTAVLTATTPGGKTASCTVTVNAIEAQSITASLNFGQDAIHNKISAMQSHIYGVNYPRFDFGHLGNDDTQIVVDDTKLAAFCNDFAAYIQANLQDYLTAGDENVSYYTHFGGTPPVYSPAYSVVADYSAYDVVVTAKKDNCGEYGFSGTVTITKKTVTPPSSIPPLRSRANGMPSELEETGGEWVSIGVGDGNGGYGPMHYEAYTITEPQLMRSLGLKVRIQGHTGKVGMYIDFHNYENGVSVERTFYSQKALNTHPGSKEALTGGESYACTFKHPESQRIYFSFEDWVNLTYNPYDNNAEQANGWSDKDLNDLIFRITGFKSITETDGGSEITETDETIDWIWAVEDLGATDDFDFNDVVVRITSVTTNYTDEDGEILSTVRKVTFKPLAAGGTMPIYLHWSDYVLKPGVYYETEALKPQDGGTYHLLSELASASATPASEYHRWFGESGATKMINTTTLNRTGQECTIYLTSDFSIAGFGSNASMDAVNQAQAAKLFVSINDPQLNTATDQIDASQASYSSYVVKAPEPGTPAQMFIIFSNNWRWPTERTHINVAYPDFDEWISDRSVKWYSAPASDTSLTIGPN